jgi:prenyltransferase beta subunit
MPDVSAVDFPEITPELRTGVSRGLAYLASAQQSDGSFGNQGQTTAITALSCLAFMADGNTPGRGPYGATVEKGLESILNSVQENGLIGQQTSMYDHGFATLFLGEVYGMTRDKRVREALVKATRLIIRAQNSQGGWRYTPQPIDADISVTICQVMALRSARDAGISVPKDTIDRAIEYVKGCQNPDGGFSYILGAGGSSFPRTAAGVASLYYAGVYQGENVRNGLEFLRRNRSDQSGYYFYGNYYAVQAMFLAGGHNWADWYPTIRKDLLAKQMTNGAWQGEAGLEYGTAMALLIVQVPNRFLPIFQR